MTDAPERLAMNKRHLLGRITSGPLMDHPNYQQYIREDIYEAVKAERDRLREALKEIASHRQKCHQYDEDTGQPLRDFDLEDIRIMEFAARAAIKQDTDT